MLNKLREDKLSSDHPVVSVNSVNPCLLKVEYACRGPIVTRAKEIQKAILEGQSKKFEKVYCCNIGDCHKLGQKPITFGRQVLSGCVYPELLNKDVFPSDVTDRAKLLTQKFKSVGSYTESSGVEHVRNSIASYIENRDNYPSDPDNIIITNGASSAIKLIIYSLTKTYENNTRTGIMVPVPQYPLYSATITEFDGRLIPYYLNEDNNWELVMSELEKAIEVGSKFSKPKAMVVINPGNPTGQVLSYENMVDVVKFCHKHKLLLLADEVYQHNIYDPSSKFYSFKKVVLDCGYTEKSFALVSFHSISKGYYSECGLRGGYMEIFGFDPEIKKHLLTLISSNLCSSTSGQIVLETLVNPPKENDPSYPLFVKEKDAILDEQKKKSEVVHKLINKIEGIKCNKVQGALYAFPRLFLPKKFIEKAEKFGYNPDYLYCMSLLEETGVCVVPGSGFKQAAGTYHFRMTIIPSLEEINIILAAIERFNTKLFNEFS